MVTKLKKEKLYPHLGIFVIKPVFALYHNRTLFLTTLLITFDGSTTRTTIKYGYCTRMLCSILTASFPIALLKSGHVNIQ